MLLTHARKTSILIRVGPRLEAARTEIVLAIWQRRQMLVDRRAKAEELLPVALLVESMLTQI